MLLMMSPMSTEDGGDGCDCSDGNDNARDDDAEAALSAFVGAVAEVLATFGFPAVAVASPAGNAGGTRPDVAASGGKERALSILI